MRSNVPRGWQAETKAKANAAFDFFVETYGVKWDKSVAKLVKDRDALLTFYDFPAERAQVLASTSGRQIRPLGHAGMPCLVTIESTFATVRHRTKRTKGCLSRKTGLAPLGSMLRMHLPGNAWPTS